MPDQAPVFEGYRVYPRGFLGASLGEQIKPSENPANSDLMTHNYHPDWFKVNKAPREVNRNVEALWARLNSTHHEIDNIEFREYMLKIALKAFGTDNFLDWVYAHLKAPSTGELQIDFLRDTLKFIQTGQRTLNVFTWLSMLSKMEVVANKTADDGSMNYFFVNENGHARNISVIDVIQRWCSQPGGFADLGTTLHILFGEKQ
jgi:hypothetical protein